jgi:dolichyl-phosphate-mannose--protein O-mannosyl transferase
VFLIAWFTCFKYYDQPNLIFWDENYHIASAQKYIDGVMFMEPHPPLGKLLIALGERLFDDNNALDHSSFLTTDYITSIPDGYSFRGVRFFSTLAATLSCVLFYGILLRLSGVPLFAFLMSGLLLFDNAFIVHSRSAMLEGTQLFFILLTLYVFVSAIRRAGSIRIRDYAWVGICAGLALSVKATSAILLLLFVALYFRDQWGRLYALRTECTRKKIQDILLSGSVRVGVSVASILAVFLTVFYIHISLGKRIEAERFYGASPEMQRIVHKGESGQLRHFLLQLRDNFAFMDHYQVGVPSLNRYDKGENGSYPLRWMLMGKSINYRWDREGDAVKYVQLIGNPFVWWFAVLSVVMGMALCLSHWIYRLPYKNSPFFFEVAVFTGLYVAYMCAVLTIDRVLYLYHYLVPLVFALILGSLLLRQLFADSIEKKSRLFYISIALFMFQVFWVYHLFSPFTYHTPVTINEVINLQWADIWELNYVE